MSEKIIRNRIQCLKCLDIIESKYRHDFVECKCGLCYVDGGTDYVRFGARDFKDVKVLTEYSNDDDE